MRIAMIGPFGLYPKSTMLSRALGLAKPLVRRGHAVRLLMPPWHTPDEADKTWQEDGVELRYTPLGGGVPGVTRRLVRETLAWRPDVVHSFKPKAYSGLAMWWLWQFHRHRLRLVTDTDDWEGWGGWNDRAPYSPLQKRFFAWQEQWGLRRHHGLTVASRTLQSLAWSLGVPPERVVYAPNGPGITFDEDAIPDRLTAVQQERIRQRPCLLLYSRLFEFETARLTAVLAEVHTAVPDLLILTVGAGLYESEAAQFRGQIRAAGLEECFLDVGWVEREDLPGVLSAADVGVYLMEDTLLNRTKCPVKVADMLAVGVPVAAEAVGQVSEYVIHRQTGLLRPSGDAAGLAADLIHLLQSPAERDRLSAQAKKHIAENFSWAHLAQRVEAVYEGVEIGD